MYKFRAFFPCVVSINCLTQHTSEKLKDFRTSYFTSRAHKQPLVHAWRGILILVLRTCS